MVTDPPNKRTHPTITLTKILHARNLRLDCLVTSHQLLSVMGMRGAAPAP